MEIVVEVNNISEAKALCKEACRQALEQCGQAYENHAKVYSPVDTGRLRNSINHHLEGDDTVVIETNVEYAIYQEMGTRYQSGTPFLKPAGENHIAEYGNIIESVLK